MIPPSQLSFFSVHAPFDRMEASHLAWMIERMSLAYYAKDEVVLSPEHGKVERFLVIKQGLVAGEQKLADSGIPWLELNAGECFPLGALLAGRPVAGLYRAGRDTFCYELPASDFHMLLGMSEPFRDFCTRRIANLLEQSKQIMQAQYVQSSSELQSFSSTLGSLLRGKPVTCHPETSVRAVLNLMHEFRVGAMIAVDSDDRPLGILTLPDVLARIALPEADLDHPVIGFMSIKLVTLPSHAPAHEAALAMARQGCRHVLVVDSGRLTGIVSEKDLFALQRVGLYQTGEAIRHAEDIPALQQAASDIRHLAHNMMAQGVAAEQLTQFISTFNDQLTSRAVELEWQAAGISNVCWIALGSEGRVEQTLSTDQDNALIFSVPEGMTANQMREKLLPVARSINENLALCGYPLCKGNVMASNPAWCLSLEEWRGVFLNWIINSSPAALLHASIFFDFRPISGKHELAVELRSWLARVAADQPRFLHQMAENALVNRPPLGVLRDFVVGREHKLDLKVNGITPFVDAARIFALANGVADTNTVARFYECAGAINVKTVEVEAWANAFLYIQMLRLRHHHEGSMDNLIDPGTLNELDRRILKEAFRQARKVQAKLAQVYQL